MSRIERGLVDDLPIILAGKLAAVVGLDLVLSLYPAPGHVRDAAQIGLLRGVRNRLGPGWSWRYEVPLAIDRDQRAWDAWGRHKVSGLEIAVDAETRVTDSQALLRRENLKKRDGQVGRLVLVVNGTKHNRRAVEEAREAFTEHFPIGTRRALEALIAGKDPGADALVFVSPVGPTTTTRVDDEPLQET